MPLNRFFHSEFLKQLGTQSPVCERGEEKLVIFGHKWLVIDGVLKGFLNILMMSSRVAHLKRERKRIQKNCQWWIILINDHESNQWSLAAHSLAVAVSARR